MSYLTPFHWKWVWPRGPLSVQFCSHCMSTTFSLYQKSAKPWVSYRLYVEDTKLLLALPPPNISVAISDLNSDVRKIAKLCSTNSLLINPKNTKLLVVGVPQLRRNLSLPPVILLGTNIKPSPVVKDLGVWINSTITFNDYVSKLSSSCLYDLHVRRINRIKHLLDNKTPISIINALIFSRLFIVLAYG